MRTRRILDLLVRWKHYHRIAMEHEGTKLLRIGEVARLMNIEAQTIRNYEKQRLIKPSTRSEGGQRLYDQEVVAQLQFIKRAKLSGITIAEVKEILSLLAEGGEGEHVLRLKLVLEEKLREAEWRMEEISAFRDSLLFYLRWFEEK